MPPKPYEARLLKLATWILSRGGPVTRGEIYAAFPDHYRGKPDTKERMFSRDKDALRRLGFHLETEEVGGKEQVGYTIEPRSSMLPSIDLSADEAAAAWTAGLAALRLSPHPMRSELESALRKLVVGTKGLPPRAAATDELASEGDPAAERLLPKLAKAWEERQRLRIRYWRVSTGEEHERDVDVYGWARRRGEWIFVGYCHHRQAVRIFYLSRVRGMKNASVPKAEREARASRGKEGDYDVPDAFDVRAWSRQQPWDYDVHAPRAAAVRFRGSLAGIAHNLLPAGELTREADGSRTVRVQVRNLRGLVRQALAWGPDAELTDPPDGRAMAREILAEVLAGPQWGTP
jgi:predicted DNA-binding transcriptional regulator YafY